MNMVERMACVLAAEMAQSSNWEDFVGQAEAAIAAMREPTEAMIKAGQIGEGDSRRVWTRMIDAALDEDAELTPPTARPMK
jgi:hypothetical protein